MSEQPNSPRSPWFWLLWAGFVGYAVLLAPPDRPDTLDLIVQLSTGQVADLNPAIVALFNLMGIWPMVYGAVMLTDGRGQSVRAWPFWAGSMALGAFALLPYLALRRSNPQFVGAKSRLLGFWESRWLAIGLTVGAIGLLGWGFSQGDWADFAQQWQTSRFIHVMSLDFVMLSLLFGVLVGDDLTRRGWGDRRWWRAIVLIPLVGPLAYLVARPPLPKGDRDGASPANTFSTNASKPTP
ncbi:MAG: DUF2834 domain-containing protein [Oscillatoriales cyanobacterium]|nr:MAG: DUF2834 domain-containing protein [Oscillatoriales cyanobacterium]